MSVTDSRRPTGLADARPLLIATRTSRLVRTCQSSSPSQASLFGLWIPPVITFSNAEIVAATLAQIRHPVLAR
jgi:hypothetical protein